MDRFYSTDRIYFGERNPVRTTGSVSILISGSDELGFCVIM